MERKLSQRWYYIYFFLAAFDVITVVFSLYLTHEITELYRSSVDENSQWAERLSTYSALGLQAGKVNAPGNDVFDSQAVTREQSRLHEELIVFRMGLERARAELAAVKNPGYRSSISDHLARIEERMGAMVDEATLIFSLFSRNQSSEAASRMATMDRRFAEVNNELFALRESVSTIQQRTLQRQGEEILAMKQREYWIALSVLLMITGTLLYGRYIAHKMREQNRERELLITEVMNQRRALDEHSLVAITNTRGTIIEVNQKFCDVSGYSREELIGQDHRILNSGLHDREFWRTMYRTVAQGKVWHGEIRNRAKDGHLYWLDSTIFPVRDEGGKISRYIALRTDITARKNSEEVLLAAKEEALRASQIKSEFLANMSHEIRTPMNGILGMTDLALSEEISGAVRDYLETARSSGHALLTIINDILDFSKIEAGKLQISPAPMNLESLINRVVAVLGQRISERELCLVTNINPDVPTFILCDDVRLGQVITNLVGNAIKFTPQGGGITLSAELAKREGSRATILFSVTDSGLGIPEEARGAIFEAFKQADGSTTRRFGGTGLGLSISKNLVELMGGGIWVESRAGTGSRFQFTIQAEILSQERAEAAEAAAVVAVSPHARAEPLRVLLVEDNQVNQKLISRLLEREGCVVTVAQNGKEATEILCDGQTHAQFELVFMDCQMPIMGGFEATEVIRQFERSSGLERLPIIALTANAMEGDKERCLTSGMDNYLSKPIELKKFRELLHASSRQST